ncbi:MAG: HlyB/MsbA family ABC transporter [Acidimicrobiia bacterium]|nr:MAG: HlyB/MsbA family ABC transporter [Acidimicrobiia bacterium]
MGLFVAGRRAILRASVYGVLRVAATGGLVWWVARGLGSSSGWWPAVAAGLVLARVEAARRAGVWSGRAVASIEADLRLRVFQRICALGGLVDRDRRTGELVSRATAGVGAVALYGGSFLPTLIAGLAGPALLLVWLTFVDPVVGGLLTVGVVVVPGLMRLVEKRFRSVSDRYREQAELLAGRFLDAVQAIPMLRTYGRLDSFGRTLETESETLRRRTMGLLAVNQLVLFLVDTVLTTTTVVLATWLVVWRAAPVSQGLGVVLIAAVMVDSLSQIGRFFYVGAIGRAAAEPLRRLLGLPIPEPVSVVEATADGGLELIDVWFSYPDGDPVLRGVTFRAGAGETVALVGPSGSGKTTIAYLVMGLLRPSAGTVRVAGRDPGLSEVRDLVSFVPQDPRLFSGTIADNLRLARPDASWEEMEAAARAAHLDEVVERLPQGWDTQVGEGGLALSGGEARRLAVARALLRDTPVVVLDEPTADLDLGSEAAVTRGIRRLTRGKTTLIIAHRASTLMQVDRVVVVSDGRVVDQGSPSELAGRPGLFSRMVAR